MRTMTAMIAATMLAGCGGGGPAEPQAAATPEPPSAFQNQVAALSVPQRNAVLIRAILDAGLECQGVTESKIEGTSAKGDPLYSARCTDGATYGIAMGRDGTAQVTAAPTRR